MLPGAIAAPSLVANVIMENIGKGMPSFRIEDGSAPGRRPRSRQPLALEEDGGRPPGGDRRPQHALATAFCIATDATGMQPILPGGHRPTLPRSGATWSMVSTLQRKKDFRELMRLLVPPHENQAR